MRSQGTKLSYRRNQFRQLVHRIKEEIGCDYHLHQLPLQSWSVLRFFATQYWKKKSVDLIIWLLDRSQSLHSCVINIKMKLFDTSLQRVIFLLKIIYMHNLKRLIILSKRSLLYFLRNNWIEFFAKKRALLISDL